MIPKGIRLLHWPEVRPSRVRQAAPTITSTGDTALLIDSALAFIARHWLDSEAANHQTEEESGPDVSLLLQERDQLRRENEELRAKLDLLSAEPQVSTFPPEEPGLSDPHQRWIHLHRDELAKHPDSFFAVNVESGTIVERSQDEDELNRKLMERFKDDVDAWSQLMIVDASLYF